MARASIVVVDITIGHSKMCPDYAVARGSWVLRDAEGSLVIAQTSAYEYGGVMSGFRRGCALRTHILGCRFYSVTSVQHHVHVHVLILASIPASRQRPTSQSYRLHPA